jgi:hypothetical protein
MGNIESLTVMSTEGATEVVRNATRAVAESAAVIRGLSGRRRPQWLAGCIAAILR